MAINFPATPTLNQTYTYNGRTWTYNNVGWQATGSTGLTVYTKTNFTATAAQTTFSVTYTVGFVDVYYNGSKLSSSEYTATTGSTVVLGTACALNDIVETIAWTISSSFNPSLGSASATSLAIGGATIGSNALAVTGSSLFPGSTSISSTGLVGIGMTPSNILDITQNQNGNTITKLLNSNAGAGALAFYSVSNGTSALNTVMYGTGFTTSGISRQNGGYIGAGGAGGLTFTTEAAQPIYFGINLVEVARFDTSGRLQLSNALIYGGVTLSNAVTGTGSMVLSISPTLTGTAAGQTNNAASETYWQVLNNSASNGAFAILRGSNGTSNVDFGMTGTGYSGVGSYTANQAYIRCDAANGVGIYAPTGPIKFNANGWSEVGRFGTNGLFYLGTTANNVVTAGITVVSGTNYAVSLGASSNGGTYYYQYMTGGTGGTISNNGTITTYASTSDERMKDWVGVVQSDKRQMISDLWLGDFDIYDDFTKTGTPHRGFGVRAQQAYGVLGTAFGFGPPHEETGIWQAPSEPMAFLALWGVKDLYKIIDDLTTRLEALESK